MAKELKQRKIKNDNKKYLQIGGIVALVVLIIVIIIISILNNNKKSNNKDVKINNSNIQNKIENTIKENTKNNIEENKTELSEVKNPLKENLIIEEKNNNKNEIVENNKNENTVVRDFGYNDAIISGIQREMTEEQVKLLLGAPSKVENSDEMESDNEVKKYYYKDGKLIIDFVNLYQKDKFVVHRIYTTDSSAVLSRNIKIGSSKEDVIAAYRPESILKQDADMIVVGFEDEDPIYATTVKPKIYFKLQDNKVFEVYISIGNEN